MFSRYIKYMPRQLLSLKTHIFYHLERKIVYYIYLDKNASASVGKISSLRPLLRPSGGFCHADSLTLQLPKAGGFYGAIIAKLLRY